MQIYKGEDKTINITITSENGGVVDLSSVVDVVVVLYYKGTGVILNKYKKIAAPGYDTFTTVSAIAGQGKILLQRASTSNAPEGLVVMDVKMQFTNAAFQAGVFDAVNKGVLVGQISEIASRQQLVSPIAPSVTPGTVSIVTPVSVPLNFNNTNFYQLIFASSLSFVILGPTHKIGREPAITIYNTSGQIIFTGTSINSSYDVAVNFNSPTSGKIILT